MSPDPRGLPPLPKKKLVLVVDDLDSTRELVGYYLQRAGYEVCFAKDGPSALEAATARKPDAVLLDVLMPGLDGYSVCKQLKANPALRAKVILFSALSTQADRYRAEKSGCDGFLEKPVQAPRLLEVIKSVLT